MKIGSNIFSLTPQRYLNRTAGALQTSIERLSSGKRINSARDDAAGLSMSIGLDAQVRGSAVAIRNANDGMSMLSVAEGAMNEMTNLLQSMRELAVQAANGTLSSTERSGINDQIQGLIAEFDRISSETDFNGMKLLDGTFGTRALQVGGTKSSQIEMALADFRKEEAFQKTVGTGTFESKVSYDGGTTARDVTTADVDGDGILDVITASEGDNAVNVLIGNGDGTFKPKVSYYGGSLSVATADVNGDGVVDLISNADGVVNVLIGNGDGTFRPRVSYGVWSDDDIATGDFNGDGIVDLATSSVSSSTVSIALGNGDGTFKAATTYTSANGYNGPLAIRAVDLNGDGFTDLAVADGGNICVEVSLGNGDGTFKDPFAVGVPEGEPRAIEIADVNGDKILDMVVATVSPDDFAILIGDGDGTFTAGATYESGSDVKSIAVGDLNGDGMLDVIMSSGGDSTVDVWLGNGDGSFKARVSYAGGSGVFGAALSDLNGDGVLDIVTASLTDSKMNVLMGNYHDVTAIADMDLTSQTKAQSAISIIDGALANLTSERASVGSVERRLETVVDSLYISRENLSHAYGEIMDTDVAFETANLVRQQILQQAGIAMLSQANVMQSQVLGLLRM